MPAVAMRKAGGDALRTPPVFLSLFLKKRFAKNNESIICPNYDCSYTMVNLAKQLKGNVTIYPIATLPRPNHFTA